MKNDVKITESHIEQLYKFTRQHFVEYYDVQIELVDHLANDIEQTWKTQPQLSFEKARDISFKKFGVFGFMDVISQKQNQMSKKYIRILWSFAKEWFKLPKIIITITAIFILHYLFLSPFGESFFYGIQICLFIYVTAKFIKLYRKSKIRFKNSGKKWMLEEMIFKTSSPLFISYTYYLFYTLDFFSFVEHKNPLDNYWATLLFPVFFVIISLICYITLTVIPEKGEELLEETYPEYKMS